MSETLEIFGREYTGVTGIKAKDDNGNLVTFIKPEGTLNVSQNGTVDVSQYASANVNVSGGGGGVLSGLVPPTSAIGENGSLYLQYAKCGILSSTGDCYIDTGVYPAGAYKAELIARLGVSSSLKYDTFFGCRNGDYARFTARFANSTNSNLEYQKSPGPTNAYQSDNANVTKSLANAEFRRYMFYTRPYYNSVALFPYSIYLFANNNAGSSSDYVTAADIKSFIVIGANNLPIYYVVPGLDSNNVPCMVDIITGNTFLNGGSGSLTYTDLNEQYLALIWEKTNGTWTIVSYNGGVA